MKILFDKDGNMLSKTMITGIELEPGNFTDELTLVDVYYQGKGATFEFETSNGKTMYMSHTEFKELVRVCKPKISGTFGFTKHGTRQSLKIIK